MRFVIVALALMAMFSTASAASYPDVKIVDINTADNTLASLKTKCGSGHRLVSIQSAEHVIWLSNKVEQLKGKTYLTQGKGIPLAYDYNQNNQYWDLNDQTRSVQAIFDKLRTDHSWGGDYQSDQTSTQQWYAGFGWSYHGIEDWAPVGHNHPESAIICEKLTQLSGQDMYKNPNHKLYVDNSNRVRNGCGSYWAAQTHTMNLRQWNPAAGTKIDRRIMVELACVGYVRGSVEFDSPSPTFAVGYSTDGVNFIWTNSFGSQYCPAGEKDKNLADKTSKTFSFPEDVRIKYIAYSNGHDNKNLVDIRFTAGSKLYCGSPPPSAPALPVCTPNAITALPAKCKCGTNDCASGKWCYDGSCQNAAKYPACPVSFHTSLTNECVCATDTTTCAVGRWCYEGSCKSTAKCGTRTENHKNLFYGAKVYGRWNATAKRMYMNFTTPWDISVGKIKWKKTNDITMQYLKASYGLWKVDKATDPCKCTYHLDVPQTTFFGAGSNFTITGSQLRTNLRVEASENIQVVKNQQTYAYTRNIKNTVPVLVNLVTRTTIAVRFRSTAAPPGPGPAPALEDFVLFVGAEDYFASDDPHVLITMKVHSRTCVDHALPDTGVRVKTGADNIKTGSTQTFTWKRDANGDIIAPYEHNLCVEELSWKFYPKKYKENTYEIELEFDLKNLPQKFSTIAAIDIKQADVLADIGFTSSINVYNNSNCTAESKNNKVILGHKFYTKIVLTDMIVDAKNITCNTYKIKQTKAGSTFETDMKGEVKYAFEEKHIISPTVKNSHICGAELESHHFHVSVDGYDTVLETEIEIYYDQTNSRRKLVTIPISHNMWDDKIWEAEVGMMDDGFEEVGVSAAKYDDTDKLFRETKRSPDQDDMVVNLFVETESVKGTAVGTFIDADSTQLFLTMSLCFLVVGSLGFVFGYSQTKSNSFYQEMPDNYNSLVVEMK